MDGVFNHVEAGLDPGRGFPYRWLYQTSEGLALYRRPSPAAGSSRSSTYTNK